VVGDGALRLSGAIWPYWQTRGHWTEGRRYLTAAVALGVDLDPERLVNSLWGGSILAQWQGDFDEGEQLGLRILEISKTAVEQEHVYSVAIHLLAIVASRRGDRDQALAWLDESLAIGRRGGDQWLLAIALNNLGDLLMGEGEYERAIELFEESLAVGEARGDLDRRARAYTNLGDATYGLGDLDRARALYKGGLEAATEIGMVECQLWALFGLAVVEAEIGEARTGARLFGRMKELMSRLGAANDEQVDVERQTLARLEARLGPQLLGSELAAGAALSLEDAIELALGRTDLTSGL
jgi:tetratricopeptide (TPR) repeat protein